MRNTFLLLSFLFVGCVGVIAQNKTLGVGTSTPNPNAALHVESPTNNQGLLMPRMTTAQRTAASFTSALSVADIGLLVFDTDKMGVYVWEGTQWGDESMSATITTTTGNAGYFAISNPGNAGAALYATTNGSGVTAAAILAETATAFSAITARGTGAAANAVTGIITDPGPGGYAVLGTVSATGGGQAGVFNISNPANANNTLEATTNGTGGGAFIKVTNAASTKPALWAETNSNQPLSAPIFGLNTGTGDVAASFRINNAANTFPALYAETSGTGRGATIRKTNTGGSQPGLFVSTEGGRGIWADHNGATGNAGIFQIINAANTNAALFAEAVGAGPSIWANKDPGESGNSFEATHSGTTGYAGNFIISNAANGSAALNVETNSNGFGVRSFTTGTEVAGYFQTSNAAATSSTVFGLTNAPGGHAIGASNIANGSALSIFQGGMKISTFEVTTGTTIATRAAAYRITGGGPAYTISFATATGDIYMVYNDTAGAITFEGVSIPSGTGKIVINFNSGSFRGL